MLISDSGILQDMRRFKQQTEEPFEGVVDPHEMKQVMYPSRGGTSKIPHALFWFARKDKRFGQQLLLMLTAKTTTMTLCTIK